MEDIIINCLNDIFYNSPCFDKFSHKVSLYQSLTRRKARLYEIFRSFLTVDKNSHMAYDERQIIQIVRILSVTLYIYSDIQRWYKNFDMNRSADVYTCCEYHKINRLEQQFYLHRRSKISFVFHVYI